MFRNTIHLFLATVSIAAASPVFAHEEAKGPHGGHIMEASGHHIEFVPSPTELTFYLSDETGKPIQSAGTKAKALVQDGGTTTSFGLTPADPDHLTGKLAKPLSSGAKVAVTATMADGHNFQARYVLP